MNGRVVVLTVAYNAETTIGRAMDSIVKQTYSNWVYYVFDNGSTDGTRHIIEKYAATESQIVAMGRNDNDIWSFFDVYPEIIRENECNWFISLDADDEYEITAFEDLITFAVCNELDVVACGNNFIDDRTKRINGIRAISNNLVVKNTDYSQYFPMYYQFLRTIWGKLYSSRILRELILDPRVYKSMGYGGDTFFVLKVIDYTIRFGILSKPLYSYYVSSKSASYTFNPKRIVSDNILFDTARDFLISKAGYVSPINNEFLLAVYMNALNDTLKVLLGAELPEAEKLEALRDMFLCEHARKLAAYERFGALLGAETQYSKQRRELFGSAAAWLLSREEIADGQVEGYCELGEFLGAASEDSGGWIFFKKLLARFLINQGRYDEAKPKLDELAELLPEDMEVAELRAASA
jgi:glycosyltransferase involved in cell wall biosynthesis